MCVSADVIIIVVGRIHLRMSFDRSPNRQVCGPCSGISQLSTTISPLLFVSRWRDKKESEPLAAAGLLCANVLWAVRTTTTTCVIPRLTHSGGLTMDFSNNDETQCGWSYFYFFSLFLLFSSSSFGSFVFVFGFPHVHKRANTNMDVASERESERVQPAIPGARFYYYCYYFSSRFFMAVVLSTDLNQKKKSLCQPSILFFYFFLRRRIYENDFSRREKERKKS